MNCLTAPGSWNKNWELIVTVYRVNKKFLKEEVADMNAPSVYIAQILFLMLLPFSGNAAVISGTVSDWPEFTGILTIGDGANSVQTTWSQNTWDKVYFYGWGSNLFASTEVAHAKGITDVTQISDVSSFTFESHYVGPLCDADCDADGTGEFIVLRNIDTGHYGVLRIDDVSGLFYPDAALDATWWFQTDGTSDFSVVPIPAAAWLFGSAVLGLGYISRRNR